MEQHFEARHFGRVFPGHLDNMYLVEALNVRPPGGLAEQGSYMFIQIQTMLCDCLC